MISYDYKILNITITQWYDELYFQKAKLVLKLQKLTKTNL